MTRLTLKSAQQQVSALCVRITSRDGEYRVADMFAPFADQHPNLSRREILDKIESRAYYTTDLEDAVATAASFSLA